MRFLIDTHILIWADERPRAIAPTLRAALLDEANAVFVSAASVWEIAIKRALGKLSFGRRIVDAVAELGFEVLPVTGPHAEHAGGLPRHHNDPFDRLIIAQAYLEGMVLGTQDPLMRPYPVPLLGLAQYTAPRAVIGQTASTRSPRTATYQKRRHSGRSAAESRNPGTPAGGHLGRRRCSWVPGSAPRAAPE